MLIVISPKLKLLAICMAILHNHMVSFSDFRTKHSITHMALDFFVAQGLTHTNCNMLNTEIELWLSRSGNLPPSCACLPQDKVSHLMQPKYHWVTVMSWLWYYHRYFCVVQVLLLASFLLRKWWWSLGCACYMEGYYRNQWGECSERQKPTRPLITRWLWKLRVFFSMPRSRSIVLSMVI